MPGMLPVLEVYYASDCAPCRAELPALAQILRGGEMELRIVILTGEDAARAELAQVAEALSRHAAPAAGDPRAVLRAAGNAEGLLPFARLIAPQGHVCARWSGTLTPTRASALAKACDGAQ